MKVCAEKIENEAEFTAPKFKRLKRGKGNPGTRHKRYYMDALTSFDIETTRIKSIEQSIMYIWQWQIDFDTTVIGRTWDEFLDMCEKLTSGLKKDEYIVVWVHNLSYEFQFLRGIYNFSPEEVFCIDRRKILKCSMFGHLEFRCSYLHSNMSLNTYTKKFGAAHAKLAGELDYNVERWPYTPIEGKELEYCINDVRGLVEALAIEMESDGDTLYTVPMTSTGYVRRDVKQAVRKERRTLASDISPDMFVYAMLREAFRGGNTHASRFYAEKVLHDVKSFDRSSSYPDTLCNCKYPVTQFQRYEGATIDDVGFQIEIRGKAVLFRVALYDVELTDESWGCPYLAKDKCRKLEGATIDNGRVLRADYLETTVTDVDWRILLEEYSFSSAEPFDVHVARYGYLPRPIIQTNIKYYRLKTELKNVPGQELLYMKSKNKLNSIYGMMAQNPVRQEILFEDDDFHLDESKSCEELLAAYNKKCFVAYAWGCWCTAWARYRLEEGIRLAGVGFVYCDTDSVKYVGDVDFTEYNRQRIADSKRSGAFATDPDGITHYMGVYEQEPTYDQFATMGAKKYVYVIDGKLHATIAGVSKKKGGAELEKAGGITAFKEGFVFHEAGGSESIYNDKPEGEYIMPNGEPIKITSNVVIKDSTYTLGVSGEYERLLRYYKEYGNPFDFSKPLDIPL